MSMRQAIMTVGGFTFLSRITGFLRDTLIAHFLGAGLLADAFFVAFKLPNFFRRFFAEGALSASFIPIFSGLLVKKTHFEAKAFAEEIFTAILIFLSFFVVIFEILMPQILLVIAPGFPATPERFELAIHMTRISFPYVLCVSLAAFLAGILNTFQSFAAPAISPIFLNLFMISALFSLTPFVPTMGHALSYGIILAGGGQLLWLYFSLYRHSFVLQLRHPQWSAPTRQLCRLLLPSAIGAGVVQINLFMDTLFASLLPTGAVSYLFYADRLNQLPLGVIGIAISTALLPELSRQVGLGAHERVHRLQNESLELALILTTPAAVGLIFLAFPLVDVLFQRGAFDLMAVRETSRVLMAFAAGLPAYVMVKVLSTSFFARQDTRTPIGVGSAAIVLNLILNLIFHKPFAHVGIALSTALSAWVNAGLLGVILWYRGAFVLKSAFGGMALRLIFCCFVMGTFLVLGKHSTAALFEGGALARFLALGFLVGSGFAIFMVTASFTNLISLDKWKKAP